MGNIFLRVCSRVYVQDEVKNKALPKWQAAGAICQNGSHSKSCAKLPPSKSHAKENIFYLRFFLVDIQVC
jgi:hypothetical protein